MIIYQVRRLTKKWIFFLFIAINVMKDINIMCALSFNSVEGKNQKKFWDNQEHTFVCCFFILKAKQFPVNFLILKQTIPVQEKKAKQILLSFCVEEITNFSFYCGKSIIWKMLKAFYFFRFCHFFMLCFWNKWQGYGSLVRIQTRVCISLFLFAAFFLIFNFWL